MKKIFIIAIFSLITSIISAANLDEAKKLYLAGKYAEALPLFKTEYSKSKKNESNASINHWIGVCLFHEKKYSEAEKYLKFASSKNVTDSPYYLAISYFYTGNYQKAVDEIEEYESRLTTAKKKIPADQNKLIESIKLASTMLDHVENVEIIDSIIVPRDDFFKHYKLSEAIGRFELSDELPENDLISLSPVYIPESKEIMYWSASDGESAIDSLYQISSLIDDSWDTPITIPVEANMKGSASYPYVLSDGSKIYFASNGEGSIGGYDIFLAGKDFETGKYYKPQNVGLPYNSPYDDYLMVIDEIKGVGWWATDRLQIPDKVVIYTFIPKEVRSNFSPETSNLESLAWINSIQDTWKKGVDYSNLKQEINNSPIDVDNETLHEFDFLIDNNHHYRSLNDFQNQEAQSLMSQWLEETEILQEALQRQKHLRFEYGKTKNKSYESELVDLEKRIPRLKEKMEKTASEIRRLEKRSL